MRMQHRHNSCVEQSFRLDTAPSAQHEQCALLSVKFARLRDAPRGVIDVSVAFTCTVQETFAIPDSHLAPPDAFIFPNEYMQELPEACGVWWIGGRNADERREERARAEDWPQKATNVSQSRL
jgi:hypothetical protein